MYVNMTATKPMTRISAAGRPAQLAPAACVQIDGVDEPRHER